MSDYTKTVDFASKDGLSSGNANKIVKGTEIDTEFDNIATAVATKYDSTDRGAANGIASLDASTLVPAAQLPVATTSAQGASELATDAEAVTAAATDRVLTPANIGQGAGVVADIIDLTDPGADRILFWDDSASDTTWLTAGTGVAISGTNLTTDDTAIDHDSLSGFVADEHVAHSGVSVTAGVGLTGGGTIAATRTIDLDISGETAVEIDEIAATDGVLVDDGGVMKRMAWQSMGSIIKAAATQTLALDDSNAVHVNTGASTFTVTVPANATVAFPVGTEMAFICESTGKITLAAAGGVTINSIGSNLTVSASGGGAYIVKTATNVWTLVGDLE